MRRYALVLLALAFATGLTWAADGGGKAGKVGEVQGTVVSVDAMKGQTGWVFKLVVTTTEGVQETFMVGPKNAQAYATAGELNAGDKVKLGWMTENVTEKWVRQIHKIDGAEGEGTKKGPRDGEVTKKGPRDGEVTKKGPRDGEVEKPGPKDGE